MEPVNAVCDMKLVKLSGTHLEMGKQLREQTLELMQKEIQSFTETMKGDLKLDSSFATGLLDTIAVEANKKISKTLTQHAPKQLKLIEGMATGKQSSPNIDSKHFFLALYMDMFLSDWKTQYKIIKEGGCSGIIITPEASQTGEMLIGRNYDLTYSLGMTQILKHCTPSSGFKNMGIAQAVWPGCHTGLNEKGLYIGYNLNHPRYDYDKTHRGIPYGIIIQEALETCSSADEAIEYITKNAKRASGANLIIGDPKNAYVIEVSRKKYGVRTPEKGVLAETNHYVHPDMLSENLPEFPILRYNFKPLEDELITTHKRYETEVRLLNAGLAKGKLTMEDLQAILQSHEPNKKHSPCNHGPVGGTLASAIIKPAKREMYIAVGQPCLTTYEKYTL